jgi:hypothetical protein
MSFKQNMQVNRGRKAANRVLIRETREEEAARLEKEIAAHHVTRCEPGKRNPPSSRPGWSSTPLIPISEQRAAEEIAEKMIRKRRRTKS